VLFIFYVTYMKSMRPLFQVSRYAPSYSSNTNWLASSFCLSSKEQIDGMRFLLSCEDYSSLGIGHPNNVGKTYYHLPMELSINFYFYCWTKIKYPFTFLDFTIKVIKKLCGFIYHLQSTNNKIYIIKGYLTVTNLFPIFCMSVGQRLSEWWLVVIKVAIGGG
jgi:hypothetical protein